MSLGSSLGVSDGSTLGRSLGDTLGSSLGSSLGVIDGSTLGLLDGVVLGPALARAVGLKVFVGSEDGEPVGIKVGKGVVGEGLGGSVGGCFCEFLE